MAVSEATTTVQPLGAALRQESARLSWDGPGRQGAAEVYARSPMPTWRRGRGWTLEPPPLEVEAFRPVPIREVQVIPGSPVRMVDGRLWAYDPAPWPGVTVHPLEEHPAPPQVLRRRLGEAAPADLGRLEALNRAAYTGGVLIHVAAGAAATGRLEVRHEGNVPEAIALPRVVVVVEQGARLSLLESVQDRGQASRLHVGVTELLLDEGATLDYVDLAGLAADTLAVIRRHALVREGARLVWTAGAFGGRFLNHVWQTDLVGAGATLEATGVYVTSGKEQHALESRTRHLAERTQANVVFRGAVGGHGRSVFDGIISSITQARATQSYLGDHILFLSREARADAIPRLDIQGSDVKISHGASVGRVDPEQVYYLETRGIPPEVAREMLIMGYFDPTLARIPDPELRQRWQDEILQRVRT